MAKRKTKNVVPAKKESLPAKAAETPPAVPPEAIQLTQIERLSKMGTDFGKIFDQSSAKGMYAYYGTLSLAELQARLKVPTLTVLERSIIIHVAKMNSTGKDSLAAISYFHDRVFGKVENKTEITGANGGPLKIENDAKMELERRLTEMDDEQLAEFEANLGRIKGALNGSSEPK